MIPSPSQESKNTRYIYIAPVTYWYFFQDVMSME
uniref:Uncharacterized protein n=1 Tax=Arundo donax TaxID=35708 RepID=A0A0A9ADN9_ARUDO